MFKSYFPLFLLIYEFCSYLSNDMYLPALILIERDFSTSTALVQASIMTWYAGLALPQLSLGALSDRFGRKIVLCSGGTLFLLASIGCALSTHIYFFLICRFLEGMGVCSLLVSGYAAIHESFDDAKAIRLISWMGCITIFAPMLGPLAGSYFLLISTWRAIFWVITLSSAAAIFALMLIMPETNITRGQRREPGSYIKLLKNRCFLSSSLTFGLLISVMIGWISSSPFLLMQDEQLTFIEFGLAQIPIFAFYGMATRFVGIIHDRYGSEKLFKIGFGIIFVAALIFVIGHLFSLGYEYRLILPISIYACGFGLISAPLNRSVFTSTDVKKGIVTAMFYLIEMGTASLIVLSLSFISFFSLVLCATAAACFSMFMRKANNPLKKYQGGHIS